MKKVVILLMLLMLLGTESYGAVSEDVYVRRDVYDANMQTMNAKLDMILEQLRELREEQKAQRADITELTRSLSVMSERVDRNFETLSGRIDGLDKRIDGLDKRIDGVNVSLSERINDLRNGIYLWLAAMGLLVAIISWPKVQDKLSKWGKSAPSITLDDVRRLIEEHDMKLSGKPQL